MNAVFTILFLSFMAINSCFAGNSSGGGGDASEMRVNEIRLDILSWINKGGAKELSLPATLSYYDYVTKMKIMLKEKKVMVGFTTNTILVSGNPKTCKGFIHQFKESSKPQILCNISRFLNTSEADQYKLIHHEYAGLAGVEKNVDGFSDYLISKQLTSYLEEAVTLKLVVKKNSSMDLKTIVITEFIKEANAEKSEVRNLIEIVNEEHVGSISLPLKRESVEVVNISHSSYDNWSEATKSSDNKKCILAINSLYRYLILLKTATNDYVKDNNDTLKFDSIITGKVQAMRRDGQEIKNCEDINVDKNNNYKKFPEEYTVKIKEISAHVLDMDQE